jgi:hypothetical protein
MHFLISASFTLQTTHLKQFGQSGVYEDANFPYRDLQVGEGIIFNQKNIFLMSSISKLN